MNLDPNKIKLRRSSSPGCRITQKSASMDEHHYFPSSNDFPRFRSLSGCRITEKNRCMGDYNFTYPVIEGVGGYKVNESEFHCRITAKYRAMSGYKYVYPIPGKVEVNRNDLISAKEEKLFVPREVDKLVSGGVEDILKSCDGDNIYIVSKDGELLTAAVKSIGSKKLRRSKTLPVHLEATPTKTAVVVENITPEPPLIEFSMTIDKSPLIINESVEPHLAEVVEEPEFPIVEINIESPSTWVKTVTEEEKPAKKSWLDKYKVQWETFSLETKHATNCLVDFGEYRQYCEEEEGIDFSQFEIQEENEIKKESIQDDKLPYEDNAQVRNQLINENKIDDIKPTDEIVKNKNLNEIFEKSELINIINEERKYVNQEDLIKDKMVNGNELITEIMLKEQQNETIIKELNEMKCSDNKNELDFVNRTTAVNEIMTNDFSDTRNVVEEKLEKTEMTKFTNVISEDSSEKISSEQLLICKNRENDANVKAASLTETVKSNDTNNIVETNTNRIDILFKQEDNVFLEERKEAENVLKDDDTKMIKKDIEDAINKNENYFKMITIVNADKTEYVSKKITKDIENKIETENYLNAITKENNNKDNENVKINNATENIKLLTNNTEDKNEHKTLIKVQDNDGKIENIDNVATTKEYSDKIENTEKINNSDEIENVIKAITGENNKSIINADMIDVNEKNENKNYIKTLIKSDENSNTENMNNNIRNKSICKTEPMIKDSNKIKNVKVITKDVKNEIKNENYDRELEIESKDENINKAVMKKEYSNDIENINWIKEDNEIESIVKTAAKDKQRENKNGIFIKTITKEKDKNESENINETVTKYTETDNTIENITKRTNESNMNSIKTISKEIYNTEIVNTNMIHSNENRDLLLVQNKEKYQSEVDLNVLTEKEIDVNLNASPEKIQGDMKHKLLTETKSNKISFQTDINQSKLFEKNQISYVDQINSSREIIQIENKSAVENYLTTTENNDPKSISNNTKNVIEVINNLEDNKLFNNVEKVQATVNSLNHISKDNAKKITRNDLEKNSSKEITQNSDERLTIISEQEKVASLQIENKINQTSHRLKIEEKTLTENISNINENNKCVTQINETDIESYIQLEEINENKSKIESEITKFIKSTSNTPSIILSSNNANEITKEICSHEKETIEKSNYHIRKEERMLNHADSEILSSNPLKNRFSSIASDLENVNLELANKNDNKEVIVAVTHYSTAQDEPRNTSSIFSYESPNRTEKDENNKENIINKSKIPEKDRTKKEYAKYSNSGNQKSVDHKNNRTADIPIQNGHSNENNYNSKVDGLNTSLRTHNLLSIFFIYDWTNGCNQQNTETNCPLLKELLCHQQHNQSNNSVVPSSSSVDSEEVRLQTDFKMAKTKDVYVAIMDFAPMECDVGAIPMKDGQEVEIIDSSKPRKWRVRTRPMKGLEAQEGWVPTCYLEKKTASMTDIPYQIDTRTDPKEKEAVLRREAIVKELVETEEDFARDMQYVVDNYYLEMDNPRMPKDLRDQRDSLFTNFKPICEFHNNVLIKGVQYYAKEPALLGKTFLRLERDFDMHVNYCRDEGYSQQLLTSGPLKTYFDEHSQRIGDDKTLSEHLKLPIQRINDYQLLLRELFKYTSRLKEDTTDLQKALDFMACIPQRSTDLKYLNAIQGYKGNIHKLGRLLKHGWMEVTEPSKSPVERYVFLFKAHIFVTEVKRITPSGDNYLVKNIVKLQDTEIVERVNEDERIFKIQHKKDQTNFPFVFRAPSSEQKEAWIRELVTRSILEDLGEDEPEIVPEVTQNIVMEEPQAKRAKVEKEMENTESDVKSIEMEEECTDAKIPSLTSDIKIELPEEEGTANITESLRSESISSLEDIDAHKHNPSKPQFQKSLRGINCLQGESVIFECEVIATPQAVVKWLKNNKPISKSSRVKITSQGNKYTLSIKEALPEDVGLYTAMANNEAGFVACSATLNLKQGLLGVPKEDSRPTTPGGTELPHAPIFKVKLKDTELLEGTSVRFELVVRGYPQPKVTFYKDNKELKEDDRVRVSYESGEVFELILDHVTAKDAGQYSCTAVNSEGKDTTTGVIKVTKHKILFRGLEEELERPPTPKPFKWFKDGRDFEASERFQVSFSEEEDTLALVFQRVTPDDAGLYTCVASTSSGNKISCSAELTVQGSVHKLLRDPEAPIIKANLTDVEVSEGASAMLELKVSGYPKPTVTWHKNGNEIKAGDRIRFLFEDDESFTLIIKNVKKEDAGKYNATAKNDLGEVKAYCQLIVTCPPSFRKKLKDMAVMTNEPVRFEVEVEGKPSPEVKWYKDGQQLSENQRIKMLHDAEEIFAMVIEKARTEDSGNYSCVLTNESGSQAGYSNLVVNAPPSFLKEMKNVECKEEETVKFSLKIAGNPKPTLKWMHEGSIITEKANYKIISDEKEGTHTLKLEKVTSDMSGKYTCEASNAHGSATTSGVLSVNKPPIFTQTLKDITEFEEQNVEFTVKFSGLPKPSTKWQKDGKELKIDGKHIQLKEELANTCTLVIEKINKNDIGKYTCEISNNCGKEVTSGTLKLKEKDSQPPKFVKKLNDQLAIIKDAVKFEVQITGKPVPQIIWYKDDVELKESSNVKFSSDGTNYSLILHDLTLQNSGTYSCTAKNEKGEASDKAVLTVKEPTIPTVEGCNNVEIELGSLAKFNAKVTGFPVPEVKWYKGNNIIQPSEQIIITADKETNSHSLTIKKIIQDDIGVYACVATNSAGTSRCEGKLSVKEVKPKLSKPSFEKKLKPVDLILGQPGRLEAKVSGEPKPKITWLKNGEELAPDEHISLRQEPDGTLALIIDSVTPENAGSYSVLAANDSGDAMTTAQINAVLPPGEKPSFIDGLKPIQFQEDQSGRLQIKISGEPTPVVKWLKDGKEISPSSHFTIMEEPDGTVNLLIDKVSPNDAGTYSVILSNEHGEVKTEAPVTTISPVTGQKPELLVELKSANIVEGQPLKLEAKISGKPSSIKWLKNGEEIKPSDRISLTTQPDESISLSIDKAVPEDTGKYSIVASNALGKVHTSSLVDVKDVPKEKPEIVGVLEPLVIKKGEIGKLTAKVIGENPEIKWMKDGKEIIPSDRIKVTKEPDGTVALIIENMTTDDAGKYSLVAANKHGENRSSAPVSVTHPPCFIKILKPIKVIESYPAKFEVQVVGIPIPDVKWLKNNVEVVPDNERIIISKNSDDGTATLMIKKCLPEDEGEYKCVAHNSSGETDCTGDLSVKEKSKGKETEAMPSVVSPLKNVTVKEGDPMILEAEISGFPIPDVTWYLDGKPLQPSETVLPTFNGEKAVLEIKQSTPQHAGLFECRLSNPLGETSSTGKVLVLERQAPRFIQRLYDTSTNVKNPTKLICRVKGDPKPEIKWYHNGTLIEPGIKYDMLQEGDTCTLTFLNPVVHDEGIYECRAKNSAGEDTSSAHVNFSDRMEKGEAPIFLKKIGDAEALEEMTVKFTACIAGNPQPDVKWYKDGQLLDSTASCKIEQESSGILRLIIREVESSDFGEYTVEIFNVHGKESCSAHLRLETLEPKYPMKPIGDQFIDFDKFRKSGAPVPLPNKPYIIKMTDDYLTLGWRPSIPNAPRVPVTYLIEMCRYPDGEWSTYKSGIKDSICNVKGLEPGQDYRFRIKVESKYGISDPSPYVTAHRTKLIESKPIGEYHPMDFELEHEDLEKPMEAPRFIRNEEDTMYGIRGQPVTIEFWVYGHPTPEITWYFDGNPMEKEKYDFMQDRNGKLAVFLSKMTDAEVGTYVCHATNELGDARQKISLQIAEAPAFIQRLERTSIMNRRNGRIECRVTGLPYPKIKWHKDWFPIYDSSRYKILWEKPDKCTLFFNNVISKDCGLYSCSASNLAGTVSCSAMVTIEESELEHSLLTYSKPNIVKSRTKPFEDFYDIGDELGRGTQAIVYHAVQRSTGNSYSAKMMHGKGKVRDFMSAEMDIMNHLCHPRLVRLWDAFESKSALTLITDLCGGGELLDNILQRGKLTEREIAHYILQVLEGLQYMHDRNIGHLGLTIGDILVSHVNSGAIKIGDFGLAAHLHPEKEYFLDYGHPEFVAPEITNKQAVTLAADMWSVGVVTYLLLSGISPFLAENDMETLKKVQQGKINFSPDSFIGVSDDAKDFMSKLLVFDPNERIDVKTALQHHWLTGEGIVNGNVPLNNIDRLRDYYKKWKDWYSNASCKRFYRRKPLESCFTHPSRMIYIPGEEFTPPSSPEPELDRTRIKPAEFDDTYKQKINREAIDFRSETNYQNGPETYLLQHRDTDFPLRIRQYLRVGASLSPSLACSLSDTHWGDTGVAVRERRRFVDIMDEEIDDERGGRGTRTIPMRLHHELGTSGYAREQMEMLKKEVWKDKGSREIEIGYAPYFREKVRDVIIQEDQEAIFTCYAVGEPAPLYSWFRNDGILLESSRIQVKQLKDGRCELRLNPGRSYDVGVYKCMARNIHGETICRARLKLGSVSDRPDTPEVDQYSDTAAYLTWRTPRHTGNTTVLCYCVEVNKGGETEWTKVASNIIHEFYVVHKLNSLTPYYFRVSAMNKFGWGQPSLPTEKITTLQEGAPKIKITKARKYQQEMTDQNEGLLDDDDETNIEVDYSIEKNPVPLVEKSTSELYNFISEITRGKFCVILKSWIKEQNATLVTKIIQGTEGYELAGKKEYEIHKSLSHKNIIQLQSASYDNNVTVLVMEKLPGMDVLSYLTSHTEYHEDTVATIIIQVLDALEYLHFRGICYIELQPDNVIMIDQKYPNIKLIDFGSAHFVPKAGGKVDVKGKIDYLAPEVISKENIYTNTDVWAVGVLTYILLSGCSPFRGENDEETANNIAYVRYHFDTLHKEVTVESTRFLIQTFKRCPLKRPTIAECLENKWLSPSEFMLRKRESAIFLSHPLHEFAEEFHSQKQSSTIPELIDTFGTSFSKSVSLEVDAYEEV